jgi:hypothetical protein
MLCYVCAVLLLSPLLFIPVTVDFLQQELRLPFVEAHVVLYMACSKRVFP